MPTSLSHDSSYTALYNLPSMEQLLNETLTFQIPHSTFLQIQLPDLMTGPHSRVYADQKKLHKSRSHDKPDYSPLLKARFDCHFLY